MNSSAYVHSASPYYNIDRDSARFLAQVIAYRPSDEEYDELERRVETRKAAKAARQAEKAWKKELKRAKKSAAKQAESKMQAYAASALGDNASVFSFRSFRSSISLLPRKNHDEKKR